MHTRHSHGSCVIRHMGHGSVEWWVTWVTGHKVWPVVSSDTSSSWHSTVSLTMVLSYIVCAPLTSTSGVVQCHWKRHHSIDQWSHMTSYQSAIVSISLSWTIFEIFDVEEYCDLWIQVRITRRVNLRTTCTLLSSTDHRAIFAADSVRLSLFTSTQSTRKKPHRVI